MWPMIPAAVLQIVILTQLWLIVMLEINIGQVQNGEALPRQPCSESGPSDANSQDSGFPQEDFFSCSSGGHSCSCFSEEETAAAGVCESAE